MALNLAMLIESAIGDLAMKIVSIDERHTLPLAQGEVNKLLSELQQAMDKANPELLSAETFTQKLTAILKSLDFYESKDFWVYLYSHQNSIFKTVSKDELINKRFWHLRTIEKISKNLTPSNLTRLREAVANARIRKFEIDY